MSPPAITSTRNVAAGDVARIFDQQCGLGISSDDECETEHFVELDGELCLIAPSNRLHDNIQYDIDRPKSMIAMIAMKKMQKSTI